MKELLSCEQKPSLIHPSLCPSTNLFSLLMKLSTHIHVLIIEPCPLSKDLMLVCSKPNIAYGIHPSTVPFHGPDNQPRNNLPLLFIYTPYSTPTPCSLLLPLSLVSTPFSLPPSFHLNLFFSVCLKNGPVGTKETRGNDGDTNR